MIKLNQKNNGNTQILNTKSNNSKVDATERRG